MRHIPDRTPKDEAGPVPMSERVREIAEYSKIKRSDGTQIFDHYYTCPECGTTELPCFHWWVARGFGTPHKPRAEQLRLKRRQKKHHNDRAYAP